MAGTRRRGLETVLGLGLAAVLIATVVVVWKSFRGDFGDDVHVSAHLAETGDALEPGDIVTYRDMIVGSVTSATANLDGTAVLGLKIHRDDARAIPAGVTAVAVPASLFGSTEVVLVPPARTSGPALHDGQVVAADTTPTAQSLQTALANAYTLLTAVHPARLDAALSALAEALQGQGKNLGRLVRQADDYLRHLAPSLPALNTVIDSLADVTGELAEDAPALLSSVGDLLVAAKGIQRSKHAIAELLDAAPGAVHDARLLLSPRNVDDAVTVLRDEKPVVDAFGADPSALPRTIAGFKSFADAFSGALRGGPYLKVNIILTGVNLATLFNVALGRPGKMFAQVSDPPGYRWSQCPRYPGARAPDCTGAATTGTAGRSATLLTTGDGYGGTVASVGSPREVAAARATASALTGVPERDVPGVVDLLLGPLLRGTPTVVVG